MSEPVISAEHLARHYEVGGGLFAKPKIVKALSE
ncbi:MAG TPA: dipeptide ABC transporter ATP-binding protein, partial [Rhodobacterales bacterium]|nr:dipeptide ABC transporter ATP-binding protein [Rhodobacterales bacterium]